MGKRLMHVETWYHGTPGPTMKFEEYVSTGQTPILPNPVAL